MSLEIDQKLKEIELLGQRKKLRESLPHLYGFPWYQWSYDFFNSKNKMNLVCAANQISKSSTMIRKFIHWSTARELWPELWKTPPLQFWYLYPSSGVATIEFNKKWVPEFLPRGEMKDDPIYGWEPEYKSRFIQAIHFKSNVSIYFKTYSQDPQDLQTGTVWALGADEETPEELMGELQMRLAATDGYFHSVFTPTLGQEYWREAMEVRGTKERFPTAFKRVVSMYDCMKYMDGTESFWTEERIQRVKNGCKSEAEIQRRVFGRFVPDTGLKYPAFSRIRNITDEKPIPEDYLIFCGVDMGSGGQNHPAAVAFVAVNPKFTGGYIFRGRRFDNMVTTASDIIELVRDMRGGLPIQATFYDHAATDLREIASRMGETWIPAEKSHHIGEQIINVLFKNKMLQMFDADELQPLALELTSLKLRTPKNQAHDDFCDALRYAVSKIPWDYSVINGEVPTFETVETEQDLRREAFFPKELQYDINDEIEEWNELYDGFY